MINLARVYAVIACRLALPAILSILSLPAATLAGDEGTARDSLLQMSIRDLMSLTVTTASKREQEYFATAAAIDVITNEDIRRYGANSLPDLLRLATGLEVLNISTNHYAISARGQNDLYSDMLQVMIDGRPIYTPTLAGVYWVMHEYPLEDVERIEVIRGPGAALWGANAVNGIINIITKSSFGTDGNLLVTGAGNEERGFGTLRMGQADDDSAYRFYLMSSDRDAGSGKHGTPNVDHRRLNQIGFRTDHRLTGNTDVTLKGDIFDVTSGGRVDVFRDVTQDKQVVENNDTYKGYHLSANLSHMHQTGGESHVSLTYDRHSIDTPIQKETRQTTDLEVQHDFHPTSGQLVTAGANYRLSVDDYTNTPTIRIVRASSYHFYGLFLQDELSFGEYSKITVGARWEKNNYTGWEFQPNIRYAHVRDDWMAWAAVSRASRVPSRWEEGLRFVMETYPSQNAIQEGVGDGRSEPEELTAYEGGFRLKPSPRMLFDAAFFYHRYDKLRDGYAEQIYMRDGYLVVPAIMDNTLRGKAYGAEISIKGDLSPTTRVKAAWSHRRQIFEPIDKFVNGEVGLAPSIVYEAADYLSQSAPLNIYQASVSTDLRDGLELDIFAYYFDGFLLYSSVPSYTRLDMRIGWKPKDGMEMALVGQDLLVSHHREHVDQYTIHRSYQDRSLYFKVTMEF